MKEQTFTLKTTFGLDPRPASLFVNVASRFKSAITVTHEGYGWETEEITFMGLLLLAADCGARITVGVTGPDENEALAALAKLIEDDFDEMRSKAWPKKIIPQPLGIPLDAMEIALKSANCETYRDGETNAAGDALIVHHANLVTRIEVAQPKDRETANGPIRAVVKVCTWLPQKAQKLFAPLASVAANSAATLGALTVDGMLYVGSRVTVYDMDELLDNEMRLILQAALDGAPSVLGAMRRALGGDDPKDSKSLWGADDFSQVKELLSGISVRTSSALGLEAEFRLHGGADSLPLPDDARALLQLKADEPHPELGGGLFCLLQLPHKIKDEALLNKVVLQLNKWEMAEATLPPHFGAWCKGRNHGNPAYVSFLPNSLHDIDGIAVNLASWVMTRAQRANLLLGRLMQTPVKSA